MNTYNDFLKHIACVNKRKRFEAITNILKENNICYIVEKINAPHALGNIVVKAPNDKGKKVIVTAHYDNVPNTPGANDNAASCAILLNIILKLRGSDANVEFVFTDLEESGFIGATSYLNKHCDDDISLSINLDMCGLGTNIVYSAYKLTNAVEDKIKGLDSYKPTRVDKLPAGENIAFIHRGISNMFVVNSTDGDLEFYKTFNPMDNKSRQLFAKTDFMKTMHQPNDTVDALEENNFIQMEKIASFVYEIVVDKSIY